MSESCKARVQLVALDGQRTVGGFACHRELGHQGRHRAPVFATAGGDEVTPTDQAWEWDNAVEAAAPICEATHELTHTAGGSVLSCRHPAGHPLWHFTGVSAWPPVLERSVDFAQWPDSKVGVMIAEARKILNDLLEVLG